MRVKWKPISVCLELVQILTLDRCTVCGERTIGSEIIFGCTRWNSEVTWVMWNLIWVRLEIVLVLVQDSCTDCPKRTIGSEIVFDAPDGTPR